VRAGAAILLGALLGAAGLVSAVHAPDAAESSVDMALVLAVDVSGSVNGERYRLQMEGIAAALEDRAVQDAMLSGPHRSMLVTLVAWSDRPRVGIPWTLIASARDAAALAQRTRMLSRSGEQFTCLAQMMRFVADKVLPLAPRRASRLVVDVSGDGRDNCNPPVPVDAVRDELVDAGVTINGLPILEGGEAETLESWYSAHVVGGAGAFLVPAAGFADFARAIRHKFMIEISSLAR
jgi:hypothetical protein